MARGKPITVAERHAIRSMLEDKLPISKIATLIKRSESLVRKYVQTELQNTMEFMDADSPLISEATEKLLYKRLSEAGMKEFDVASSINHCKKKLKEPVGIEQIDALVSYCINHKTPKELMITSTEGRNKGVAVMTQAASQRIEDEKAHRSSRIDDSCIFRQEDSVSR